MNIIINMFHGLKIFTHLDVHFQPIQNIYTLDPMILSMLMKREKKKQAMHTCKATQTNSKLFSIPLETK